MPSSSLISEQSVREHMARAIALARQAAGGVSPRPPVGAVLVRDGRVVGEGCTEPRPGRHAEVVALQQAGDTARGAVMYCTLEPHAFQGVAPPCTDEIIRAGVSAVVCPIEDANPQVDGNGFRQLKAAGVEVVTAVPPVFKEQAQELVAGFAAHMRTGRPLVTVKFAVSLDGKIATRAGDSQWITGEEARAEAHEMRRMADAVVTGIGTVLADNPRLTARDGNGAHTGRPRLRVVVDTAGRMPETAALLQEPGDVLWVRGDDTGAGVLRKGLEVLQLPAPDGQVDVDGLVAVLGSRDCHNVMVEGGGRLAGAFFDAGLVDRVAAFIAPVVIGGEAAPGPVGGAGPERLADALRLERAQVLQLGRDVLVTGWVRGRWPL